MKRNIDSDEWYPVYSLRDPDAYGGYEVEVTDEQAARWDAALEAFKKAQREMGELHDVAEQGAREKALIEKAEKEAADKADRLERQRQIKEKNHRRRVAVERLVGTVYDSAGNPVGEVSEGSAGLKVAPIVE